MPETLRLLAIFAHPDDESLGSGGALARYAAEGVETYLLTATRGERGWNGPPEQDPGLQELGRIRAAELEAAARVLGIRQIHYLDYLDGDLDQADPQEATRRIAAILRQVRPQVVITFSPDGSYGHPDHIAISQLTAAALVCAADAGYPGLQGDPPHRVDKLYYMVDTLELVELVRDLIGGITMEVDGVERQHTGWQDWAITTRIDASAYWRTVWQAIQCHRSQLPSLGPINDLPDETHLKLWGEGWFYRAYSLVNGGRKVESDLFEGLR